MKTFLNASSDLVALNTLPEADYLSLFLRQHWLAKVRTSSAEFIRRSAYMPQEELSRDGLHRIGRFNEKFISIAVAVISILVAAILLIGSITSLYLVTNDTAKLGIVAACTAAFALSVGLMTNARRAEIFAATAA